MENEQSTTIQEKDTINQFSFIKSGERTLIFAKTYCDFDFKAYIPRNFKKLTFTEAQTLNSLPPTTKQMKALLPTEWKVERLIMYPGSTLIVVPDTTGQKSLDYKNCHSRWYWGLRPKMSLQKTPNQNFNGIAHTGRLGISWHYNSEQPKQQNLSKYREWKQMQTHKDNLNWLKTSIKNSKQKISVPLESTFDRFYNPPVSPFKSPFGEGEVSLSGKGDITLETAKGDRNMDEETKENMVIPLSINVVEGRLALLSNITTLESQRVSTKCLIIGNPESQ